ncbi:hypothetical protein TNCV_5029281 [Trichonephila clavipes]|nr:hypothetical protein TNCV_5029281 [Trichonephila clavipes]
MISSLLPLKTNVWKGPLHVKSVQAQSPPVDDGGCGSPVVKVPDHGRHVMSSNPVPLKIRHVGQRCMLNLSRAETSSPLETREKREEPGFGWEKREKPCPGWRKHERIALVGTDGKTALKKRA